MILGMRGGEHIVADAHLLEEFEETLVIAFVHFFS